MNDNFIDNYTVDYAIDCDYYDDSRELRDRFGDANDKFIVLHMNIRSFNCNIDEFTLYLRGLELHVDVLILTETWFSVDNCHDILGYKSYHSYRKNKRGGGVSIYVNEKLKSNILTNLTFDHNLAEFCSVSVRLSARVCVTVVGFYRAPNNASINQFCDILRDNVLSHFSPSQQVVIGGDANIDLFCNDNSTGIYTDLMHSKSFVPYITLPTRETDHSCTLVDHLWSNNLCDVVSGVIKCGITDHYITFICLTGKSSDNNLIVKKFRNCSATNVDVLRTELSVHLDQFHEYDSLDVDLRTEIFNNIFKKTYDECCPVKTKHVSRSRLNKPWFNNELMAMCNRKHHLFRKYRSGEITFSAYNEFKNKFTSILKKSKFNYFRNKFRRCQNDIKSTWKNVNCVLGRNGKRSIDKVFHNGQSSEDPAFIPQVFNDYFSSVAQNLRSNIPIRSTSHLQFMGNRSHGSLDFKFADIIEVNRVIMDLPNKSSNINSIPTFIFKYLSGTISPVLCDLFNSSYIEGRFPDCLKLAEVIPIFKSGSPTEVKNFRPISLLSVVSKIFERLMRVRLVGFLENNNLISGHQFGFRSQRNTSDAILEFLTHAYNSLDTREHLVSVFLDLSKAFDTLDHSILTSKLEHIGVRGGVLKWFSSYLSGRRQIVTVGGFSSGERALTMGVPQGSVLGPLLFLIYINDMSRSSNTLNFVHFADDTTLFLSGSDLGDVCDVVNGELTRVDEWLMVNMLSLNVLKTTYMVISHSNVPNDLAIKIRNVNLERASVAKFLGVLIDDKLTFRNQVDSLCKKISKSVGVLYKLSKFVPPPILRILYFSLVQSGLIYGITSWGGSSDTNLNRLKSLQDRAVKMLPVKDDALEVRLPAVLDLTSLYKYFCGIKTYKSFILGQHEFFVTNFKRLIPDHGYRTRHKAAGNINVPFCCKSRCQQSFLFNASKIWNDIPIVIRNSPSLFVFKNKFKQHLLQLR